MKELGEQFGLSFEPAKHVGSAWCCKALLASIIGREDIEIATEMTIPNLEKTALTELVCTKNEKPDLFLCLKDDRIAQVTIEIHSSPYEETILKAILVATNVNINTGTSFTFPKLPFAKKTCVVKVGIEWDGFLIKYELSPLMTRDEVARELRAAVAWFAVF